MELDLKKAFYMLIAIVLLGLLAKNIALPVYNKITAQNTRITTVNFDNTGAVVSP